MIEDQQKEALESIDLIKEIVFQTKKEMSLSGCGWLAIIWGIFCFVGFAGEKLFIVNGPMEGLWWTILTAIAFFATYLVVKSRIKSRPQKHRRRYMRRFFLFWIPLIILAYTLCLFCVFLPGLSPEYITIFILLVVCTGYLMLGFLFVKEILYMGVVGMISTILTAIFFLEYSDIILSVLFGSGLIITGIVVNHKWKK